MIEEIRQLRVVIPEMPRQPVSTDIPIVNANPACGPLPLTRVRGLIAPDYWNMEAAVSPAFISAQVLTRGRPHFSLLHVALVDDNIATHCFTADTGQTYGSEFRYVETGVGVCFHREAFIRGAISQLPRGTVEVDGYTISWELVPYREGVPLQKRGFFRVAVHGERLNDGDIIHVASWEGEFFRRRGVLPSN